MSEFEILPDLTILLTFYDVWTPSIVIHEYIQLFFYDRHRKMGSYSEIELSMVIPVVVNTREKTEK